MSDANKAIAQRLFDEISAGNLSVIDSVLADDFVEHEEMPGLTPNRDGVKALFEMMRGAFPDFRMDVELMVAEGDLVSALVVARGTHKGEFMGIPATDKAVAANLSDLFRIRDGKVVEHWGVMDMAGLMRQLSGGAP